MKIAICDDDITIQDKIKLLITDYSAKHKIPLPDISVFSSGEPLIASNDIYDICFLDVQLPGISGIHVGKVMSERNRKCLNFIITSHEDYLDEAMHFHAFRFLTKPIDQARFFRNYADALQSYFSMIDRTVIETKDGVYTVDSSDIVMIEARFKKILVTTTSETFYSTQRFDHWLNKLNNSSFYQTHRSYIVNMAHVDNFNHNTVTLFHGECTAYLTARKYTDFKRTYLMYLECMR